MKTIHIITLLLSITISTTYAQQPTTPTERILYGVCTQDSLLQAPYSSWYSSNYSEYIPNATVTKQLQQLNLKGVTATLYFGSWCGDSKREVPRMLKVLITIGIPNTKLIALGNSDSLTKQSPTGEQIGQGIFKVPVCILYKAGKEVGRIMEYPAVSLEHDMLTILSGQPYTPNYASFATLNAWLLSGILADDNVTAAGLANIIKQKVHSPYELLSLGNLLYKQGYTKPSLKVHKINYNLYPADAAVATSLGNAYIKAGELPKAVTLLEQALIFNKDEAQVLPILKMLYQAKGIK